MINIKSLIIFLLLGFIFSENKRHSYIFYYPWYGNPKFNSEYRHWNHEIIGNKELPNYHGEFEHSKYSKSAHKLLTDGVLGSIHFNDNKWLGLESNHLNFKIKFPNEIFIENIDMRFLNRQKDWIFPPKYLKCKILNNHFKQTFDKEIDIIKNSNEEILTFSFYINKNIKEIEIFAENISKCPEWHVGTGKPSWIFIDEIIVN